MLNSRINCVMSRDKNRQLLLNLVYNVGAFAINLCLIFLLTPFLIKSVGKEAYGFYPLINNMIGYSTIISSAIGSMGGRFITIAIYQNNKELAQTYFNSIVLANWIISFFLSLVFLVAVFFLPQIINIPSNLVFDVKWMFLLSGISLLLGLCFDIFGIGTYVKNRIDIKSSRTLCSNMVNAIAVVFLFSLFEPNIIYIAIAALVGALASALFNIRLKRVLLPEVKINPLLCYSWKRLKELISSGIWNSVNQLSNVLLNHVDLLIANIFISVAATGDYAIVKIAPTIIYTTLALLSSTFIPSFNILYAQGKKKELVQEIKKSMKIVGLLICFPIGFLLVYADDFFSLWVPSQDSNYLYWLSFFTVLPMIFGASINPIFGVFSVTNRLRVPSLVLLFAGIINTMAIFILLQTTSLGLWSIPLVGAIQQGVRNFFFSPMYASKCLDLKLFHFYPTVLKCCLGLLVIICLCLFAKQIVICDSWFMLAIVGIFVFIIGMYINLFVILSRQERDYLNSKLKVLYHVK